MPRFTPKMNITMHLWIFLSTDNVLTLQQSGTGVVGGVNW